MSAGGRLPRPPFGRELAERLSPPFLTMICAGSGCWDRARRWNESVQTHGLVWPGDRPAGGYDWPVRGHYCVVEWPAGQGGEPIEQLICVLLEAGARCVISRPLFRSQEGPIWSYDPDLPPGRRFAQERDYAQIFPGLSDE